MSKSKPINSSPMPPSASSATTGSPDDLHLPPVLNEAQRQAIRDAYAKGATQAEVAKAFGISRPSVSRIVLGRNHEPPEKELARRLARNTTCILCGEPVLGRDRRVTCDEECARLYKMFDKHTNPALYAKHRQAVARAILAQKRRSYRSHLYRRWARAVLENDPGPRSRYIRPGMERRAAARRIGLLASFRDPPRKLLP